ncbi:MAG: Dihydroorotate dehydrogenase, electron transfer subunit [Promethearchaeota archaeon CR_4]|nr:MAG: Dihydroorotate dehydrogenase, electron transfer subunit [Candidatus Lokiarchaeota archaeon CR_4]
MIRKPKLIMIEKMVHETKSIVSLYFHYIPAGCENKDGQSTVPFTPGQFFMIWLPHLDEIPISVSFFEPPDYWGISVKIVGEATRALCGLHVGEQFGVRGPLGSGFEIISSPGIFFGGGVGLAPLRPAILRKVRDKQKPTVVNCAPCGEDLLFHGEFEQLAQENGIDYYFATEDGSCGCQGLGTELLVQVLEKFPSKTRIKYLAACGPERMLVKALDIAEKFKVLLFQASLERMMRCGMGMCGLCAIDPLGLRVCKDGPVFSGEVLRKCTDFGRKVREFTGHKRDL